MMTDRDFYTNKFLNVEIITRQEKLDTFALSIKEVLHAKDGEALVKVSTKMAEDMFGYNKVEDVIEESDGNVVDIKGDAYGDSTEDAKEDVEESTKEEVEQVAEAIRPVDKKKNKKRRK
jgi:hypothetical protein